MELSDVVDIIGTMVLIIIFWRVFFPKNYDENTLSEEERMYISKLVECATTPATVIKKIRENFPDSKNASDLAMRLMHARQQAYTDAKK
ncbi:MAG: hypothetical protein KTR20_05880 [Cellvibrionaceae bacterium]|nr:hypothetical protein [Cellvibrionaceae bacterium]